MKLAFEHGITIGWICDCGRYIDILSSYCWDCKRLRPIEYQKSAFRIFWKRQGNCFWDFDFKFEEVLFRMPISDDDIEKHSRFFNHELGVVAEMTLEQIVTHIEELEAICFEAKARIGAAKQNQKERIAKLSKADRDKLVTNSGLDISESDSLIRKRVERQSRADKTIDSLAGLGLGADDIKDLMSNVKVKENVIKAASKPVGNGKGATFNAPVAPKIDPIAKPISTRESLLADITSNLANDVKENTRPENDVIEAVKTAAHLGRKVNPELAVEPVEEKKDDLPDWLKP